MKRILINEMTLWLSFSESMRLIVYKTVYNRLPAQAPKSPIKVVVSPHQDAHERVVMVVFRATDAQKGNSDKFLLFSS